MNEGDQADQRGAAPEDCIVTEDDDDAAAFDPFSDFHDSVELGPIQKVMGADGLPTQHAPFNDSHIPKLGKETLTCMADESEHVLRNGFGYIIARTDKPVIKTPKGESFAKVSDLSWSTQEPSLEQLREVGFRLMEQDGVYHVKAQPIRPQCKHYARQFSQYERNPENRSQFRLCTARRSTGGAFMDIADLGIYACELRDPPDFESLKLADEFDRKKIKQGQNREYLPIFEGGRNDAPEDRNEAIEGILNSGVGAGGILSRE